MALTAGQSIATKYLLSSSAPATTGFSSYMNYTRIA
jgi:hypothetical protein